MRDEGGDQQIANKDMELPPARGGFRRQSGRFGGNVETELQAHAAGQHQAVEIVLVAERVGIDPDEPEQSSGNRPNQKAPDRPAGEIFRHARTFRRAPPRQSHGGPPKSPSVVLSPSSSLKLLSLPGSIDRTGFPCRALELVGCGYQAVEPTHRPAVILLGDARARLGGAGGGSRQEAFIVLL